ncbi:MAG: tRNA lysidine(34) synthetase TilS [Gaiellaceae bacterium]
MDADAFRARVAEFVREHELIPPGGEVECLVSGGPDSTCLWHVLRSFGYDVSAVHVDHGLRGDESAADARFCADRFDAVVVDGRGGRTEAELREIRYDRTVSGRTRATGQTKSDQVETVLYNLVSRGHARGIKLKREDGVVRPLLCAWRDETLAYCEAEGLEYRLDSTNPETMRGLLREQVLPLLRRLHPAADENILRALDARETLPPALAELLAAPVGSKRVDLGGGLQAVREYERLWLEQGPVALEGTVNWGPWRISARERGLKVRTWRPGDRLAGRSKKIQDVFVDAKIPRSERNQWPLVVKGNDVVAVPGLVEADGVEAVRVGD